MVQYRSGAGLPKSPSVWLDVARLVSVGISMGRDGQRLILLSLGERRVLIQRRDTAAWRHHLCSFCLLLLVSSLSFLLRVMSEGRWKMRLGMHCGYDSSLYTCKTWFLSLPSDHSSSLYSFSPSACVCVCVCIHAVVLIHLFLTVSTPCIYLSAYCNSLPGRVCVCVALHDTD